MSAAARQQTCNFLHNRLEPVESCAPTEEGGMQASAPSPNQNIYNQEPPPPPPYVHPGTVISPQTYQENPGNLPSSSVVQGNAEDKLTPRQEPQGEESQRRESPTIATHPSPSHTPTIPTYHNQPPAPNYSAPYRHSNGAGDEPVIRHKLQSNSVPVQSSQYIHHTVHTTPQSRSLDASTSSHSDPKQNSSLAAPAYRAPPGYYTPAVTALQMAAGQTVSMQDKQQPAMPVSNGSTAVNKLPRNGSNQNIAYSQQQQGHEQLLPPPPEYPGNRADIRRSYEVLDRPPTNGASPPAATAPASTTGMHANALPSTGIPQSYSHPELASHHQQQQQQQQQLSSQQQQQSSTHHNANQIQTSHHNQMIYRTSEQQQDFAAIAARASKMVEVLSGENKSLRNELECYYKKVSKLQKFEYELQKVYEAHDCLMKSSVKKEGLEKAYRMKQEMEIKQLDESCRQYQERVAVLEKRLAEQGSSMKDVEKTTSKQEEIIQNLTKLTLEQKETIAHNKVRISELATDLELERTQTKAYEEELDAYKSNASVTLEEESEVKMAALTQSTKDSERIISEAQAEKLRYMDEAHQAARNVANLEAKLKTLEASCAEKDAIVRVLQRRQRSNLSGRGQATPPIIQAQHARRTSEPSSPSTKPNYEDVLSFKQEEQPIISNDALQTQTWQV